MRLTCVPVIAILLAAPPAAAAQTPGPALRFALAPRPVKPAPWRAPNRPWWKLSELVAAHAGQKSWAQTVVRDIGLTGRYIQMAAGEKSRPRLYADSRIFWIVQTGQMRVTIEGQEPFLASHGFIVQVPERTVFSMETVGDEPSLRFEVTHTRSLPLYPEGETPAPVRGQDYARIAYAGGPASYGNSKPYLDYQKEVAEGGARPGGFVRDGETAANVSRGPAVPRPPDGDPGHFHIGTSEFWFVMEGKVDYLIEGAPFFTADQGDIVYAPAGRWHRATFGGEGMASRISIHPVGQALNNLDPDHSAAAGN